MDLNYSYLLKNKLSKDFYTKEVLAVAENLLGKIFCKKENDTFFAGKIVEVEAYHGKNDEAAHTFNGRTKRNEIMFNSGGFLYVYFTYGVHHCANVVAGKENEGTAVLLRGIEPLIGTGRMKSNRFGEKDESKVKIQNLTNGPGKICQAFEIDKSHNGTDLTTGKIFISNPPEHEDFEIVKTTRIGISKSVELPWRFYIKDNPFVSKK